MTFVRPLKLYTSNAPFSPRGVVTWFGTVWPVPKLRLLVPGFAVPSAQTVR